MFFTLEIDNIVDKKRKHAYNCDEQQFIERMFNKL